MINVIYDNRYSDDYERLISEFEKQGISDYKFWDAEVYTHSVLESITASFKKIVRWAKENNLDEVQIAEQDLFFTSPNSYKYFIENKPQYFDLYISGSYLISNEYEYKAPLVRVKEYVGNQLIVINSKYYDKFLNIPDDNHVDTIQSGLGEFYVVFPFIGLQRPGYSANAQVEVNYNPIIPKEYIYE